MMEGHDDIQEDLEAVLSVLLEIQQGHYHALFSAGIDPSYVSDMESLLQQVRRSGEEERRALDGDESSLNRHDLARDEDDELQLIEDSLIPPDDDVENMLAKIIGLEPIKNQIRGMRRTLEVQNSNAGKRVASDRTLPNHLALVGNPGTGKTFIARILMQIMYKIGAVPTENYVDNHSLI